MTEIDERPATTGAGVELLQAMSERSGRLEEIRQRADEFGAVVTDRVAADVSLPAPAWLRAALAKRGLPTSLAEELTRADDSLRGDVARSFAAAVVRGLAPHSALATVPEGALGPAVSGSSSAATVEGGGLDLRQAGGAAIDYTGYLCVIAKLTRLCNLRCTYCSDWSDAPGSTMAPGVVERMVSQALGSGRRAVDFVWHGGEPLLLGSDHLLRFLELQARYAAPGQIVRNFVQSNGTVLPSTTLRFLRLFDIRVSVSLDGPPAVHDATRRDRRNGPTSTRVAAGIDVLRANGLLTAVLVVVGPRILGTDVDELWDFLEGTGAPTVCFLPERPRAGDPVVVTAARFVDFLLRVDDVRRTRRSTVAVRELDAASAVVAGRQSGFCELAGNCVGHFVSVDPNGDVMHCDKYVGDDAFVLGNLVRDDLVSVLDGPRAVTVRDAARAELAALRSCPHFERCQGWCPHERHVDPGLVRDGCCGLAPLFDRLVGTPSGTLDDPC